MTDPGEHWRQRGYELVMRLGSPEEQALARARLAEVREIQQQTAQWLAQRATWAQERAA